MPIAVRRRGRRPDPIEPPVSDDTASGPAAPAAADAGAASGGTALPRALAFDLALPLLAANGALDAYTFLAHDEVFATAQTGNVVLFALGLVRPDVAAPLPHLWPIIAFIAGVSLAHALHDPHDAARLRRPRRWVLIVEIVVLGIIAAVPTELPLWLIVAAISFLSALQLTLFRNVQSMTFVPIAMTGNLMRATEAIQGALSGTRQERLTAARHLVLIAAFTIGVVLGTAATTRLGGRGAVLPAGLILGGLVWTRTRPRIRRHGSTVVSVTNKRSG